MKTYKLSIILLTILVPLLEGCVSDSNATTPPPLRVNFSVIASGDHTVSGLPENRKAEVFTGHDSFNSSFYSFVQPMTEHTVDFSAKRVVLLSLGERVTGVTQFQ
jgi:hypothetical protein